MRYNRSKSYSKPIMRTIVVRFAGECACCGGAIKAGEMADYYPVGTIASRSTGAIAHMGGLQGNSPRCTGVLRRKRELEASGGFDVDRAYEDQCADICGR
jgi:hypothetical protein